MIPGRAIPRPTVVGIAVLSLVAAGWLLSEALTEGPVLVLAGVGGILVMAAAYLSPRFGFYALLAAAVFNRYDVFIAGVHLRPDQLVLVPVLVGVAPRLMAEFLGNLADPYRRLRVPTLPALVFGGLGLYISINLLSSYLFSPQFWDSFQIVAWFALSFLAFATAYFVIGRYVGPREAFFAVLVAGFVSGAIGDYLFLLFELTGSTAGVQLPDVASASVFKATGTFLEANLFGSFQAFTVVAAVAVLVADVKLGRLASVMLVLGTAVSVIALALSLTRAAWLGAIGGALLLVLFRLRSGRSLTLLLSFATVGLLCGLALASTGLLASVSARFRDIGASESTGTLAFRLERFRLALQEWPSSPILGLGTNSYGQRHWDPTQAYAPDYLPNLVLATLYDSGLLGLTTLLTVFAVLAVTLVGVTLRGNNGWQRALAGAMLCGATALLISYQATNGFWFSYVWIILAVSVRVCAPWREANDA